MTLPIEGCVDQNHKEKQEKELAIITIVPPPGGTNYQMLKNNPTKKEHDALKNITLEKKI